MTIPSEIALWTQQSLLGLNAEYWAVGYVTHRAPAGGVLSRWQLSVDLIYRALTCELIQVDVYMQCHDIASLLHAIRSVSPYDNLGGLLWNGTQVYGSERLRTLLDAHFTLQRPDDDELNLGFIEALERIFVESGTPWSDKPLLPIMPAQGASATSAATS